MSEAGITKLVLALANVGVKPTHAVIHPSNRTPEVIEALLCAGLDVHWRDDVPPGKMFIADDSGGERRE
jgi:hypothetical protein